MGRETSNARWVREQLERRSIPFFGPLRIAQSKPGTLQRSWGLRWYAVDRRGLEVAGSHLPISELLADELAVVWPGYGVARFMPAAEVG